MLEISKYPKFAHDLKLVKRINFLEVEWRRAYSRVNIESQLGWAHAWLISNGKKYQDMSRYLNNWFKRCAVDIEKAEGQSGPIQMPKGPSSLDRQKEYERTYTEDMTIEEMEEIKRRNMPQKGTVAEKFRDAIPAEAI